MRGLFAVAGLSLLKIRKEKVFVIAMVGLALLFSSVTSMVFRKPNARPKVPVAVADLDESNLSAEMADLLSSEGIYRVSMVDEHEVYDLVRQGKADVGFVIPAGFEKGLSLGRETKVAVVSLSTSNAATAIGKIMERKVTERLLAQAVKDAALSEAGALSLSSGVDVEAIARKVTEDYVKRPALDVEFRNLTVNPEPPSYDGRTYITGIYLMFTMFTVMFSAGDILQERRDGTWLRLMASPVSRVSVLGGKILGAYAVGALQLVVLFAAGRWLFHMNYGPNPLGFTLVMAAFLLAVTGLGLMLSTMVKTVAQLQTLSPIVISATCMLGGCYWPLEIVSPLMRTVAQFTPQAWAMVAATDIVARGMSVADTSRNILALLVFAAVFFTVGVSRVKFE